MKRKDTEAGIEFAWRVHDGLSDWTARVDTKASIALAIEAASLGFVITLVSKDGLLAHVSGWGTWTLGIGIGAAVLGVLVAIFVVFPQLRARKSKREYESSVIYFGHLRHWEPKKLEKALTGEHAGLGSLSRQLVALSRIVWRKHVWLQWSLALYVIAVVLVGASLFAPTTSVSDHPGKPDSTVKEVHHDPQR